MTKTVTEGSRWIRRSGQFKGTEVTVARIDGACVYFSRAGAEYLDDLHIEDFLADYRPL